MYLHIYVLRIAVTYKKHRLKGHPKVLHLNCKTKFLFQETTECLITNKIYLIN